MFTLLKRVGSLLFVSVLFVQLPATAQGDLASNPVYKSFAQYKTAILNDDADGAFSAVNSKTVAYYADLLDNALNLSEAETRSLRFIDKLSTLQVRQGVPASSLRSMNAETLFKYAVARGWVGKRNVMAVNVVDVEIDGSFALVTYSANGVESPAPFYFNKEAGRWKIDLTSVMPLANRALVELAGQQGMTEDEFAIMLLGSAAGEKVDDSVWLPINR